MINGGPLAGSRVIDLTDDLGRFGTKVLAELGAEVCRPMLAGSRGAPMSSAATANDQQGVLDWWFDAAKRQVTLDLNTEAGVEAYRQLARDADLIIDSQPPGHLAALGIDHGDLLADNPTLTQVSLTPFGRTGPRAGWQTSDLVAGALSGVLSITGLPDEPLNSWGWQNYTFGGYAAALCGLAGMRDARRRGRGQHVDLSLHEVMTGSIENLFMQYFYDDLLPMPKIAPRQGSLHWLGAYEIVPAKTGYVMVTPTPQAESLVDWMVESGIESAQTFVGLEVEELLERMPELMASIKEFTLTMDAGELFHKAQAKHIAFGEVQSVAQVAENPQFAHRELFAETTGADAVRGPWRIVRYSDTPIEPPIADWEPTAVQAIAEQWQLAGRTPDARVADLPPATRPLDGLRIVDLSWVLAGPFAARLLGDLGADVIKVQTEERATLVNRPDYPYYPVWNRSKRSVTLNLKHPDALATIRPLIESADVLIENYSSGVLDRLGLGWDAVHEMNDQLVYISMSGCGHDGPWKDIISYAPTVHAVCGLTHLTNPAGRGDVGCGFSLNDHAAGFAAATTILAALDARPRTGGGQHIDMAQLEVGATLLGPALVDWWANGREAQPIGNRDGLIDCVPNDVFACSDGRFVAISAIDDAMWTALAAATGVVDASLGIDQRRAARDQIDTALGRWCADLPGAEAMERLQSAGVAAGVVQDAHDLVTADPQLQAREFWLAAQHANEFGDRTHDRFPGLWSESELEPYRTAPAYLGEANFDLWTEIGALSFDEVAEAMATGLLA